jgi:hypothetical protein
MLAAWHPVAHGEAVAAALESDLHGRRLRVEHRCGEPGWHWQVRTVHGRTLAGGVVADAHSAERAAEDEVYRVHVPVGDAVAWWLED